MNTPLAYNPNEKREFGDLCLAKFQSVGPGGDIPRNSLNTSIYLLNQKIIAHNVVRSG